MKWSPAPPIFKKGAEIAVLYGDSSKEGMLPPLPPRQHEVEPLQGFGVEPWNVFRRILKIAVHHHDPIPLRDLEPCRDRSVLSEVPAQSQRLDGRLLFGQFSDHGPRFIRTPIVHEDDLIAQLHRSKASREACLQCGKARLGIVDGNDDTKLGHRRMTAISLVSDVAFPSSARQYSPSPLPFARLFTCLSHEI